MLRWCSKTRRIWPPLLAPPSPPPSRSAYPNAALPRPALSPPRSLPPITSKLSYTPKELPVSWFAWGSAEKRAIQEEARVVRIAECSKSLFEGIAHNRALMMPQIKTDLSPDYDLSPT